MPKARPRPLIAALALAFCFPAAVRAQTRLLECRSAGKPAFRFRAPIDLASFTLTLRDGGRGAAPRVVMPMAGTQGIDFNCPKPPPMSTTLNYTISSPREWGQDVLQLPKDVAIRSGRFQAELWSCEYDGDWHSVQETALECGLSPLRP